MLHDPWLDRWLPLLGERAAGAPVLELGCGSGRDTATLLAAGLDVVALEIDPAAVARARRRAPRARIHCQDIRQPFPVGAGACGAVVASLSLHYFPWVETLAIVERIRAALQRHGVLLCRLNATDDHHFGARGHPQIEPNYHLVGGSPKRFFDEAAVDRLFASGWRTLSKGHFLTRKYVAPKALWEVVLEADA